MRLTSQMYCLSILLVLYVVFIDMTYSSENDTLSNSRRHARVSGRIVKLYSGLKPDPVICLGEGFQKDTVDCAVFYRCLKASNGKYTVYRFQCGPGTVYDPETEICNHPRRTKRLECGGLYSETTTTTTKIYFDNEIEGIQKENHELPSPITTKSPIDFSTEANVVYTSKPENIVHSYITTSYPWITPGHAYAVSTAAPLSITASASTKIPREVTSAQTTFYATMSSNNRDNQCLSDGFMGDTEDCRKFYRCVNNQRGGYLRYEFSCSESTVWDDDTKSCNHPWAVRRRRCGKGSSYNENDINYGNKDTSHELPQQQISYGSKVTPSQIQTSRKPSIQNQPQINFGDRLNKEKPDVRPNQSQLTYGHPESQSQIQIDNSNNEMQTQPQIDHSYQQNPVHTQTTKFSTMVPSTEHPIENSNNNKCTKDGFMGDPNDCKKFYRCTLDGRGRFNRQEFSCSDGTLWDEKLESCNHAWAVTGCNAKTSNIQPMASTVSSPTYDYHTTTLSSLNNEIMDEGGYGNQNNVQEMGQSKPSTQTTSTRTIVTTESLKLHTSECNSGGFFGNAEDCAKFYRCVENGRGGFTKYDYKCGEGTLWDSDIESCNHAWAVKQCNGSKKDVMVVTSSTETSVITTISLIQTTTQKNIYDHEYDSGYGSVQKETSSPPTSSTERISNQGNNCKTTGFMGDDQDCKRFYRCVENGHGKYTRHEFSCGEGTVWDSEIEACNHAWAVKKCGGSGIKDNSVNQATTSSSVSEDGSEYYNGYDTPNNNDKESVNPQPTTVSPTTNTISTTHNKGKECQISGFMGDTDDCKIFYRCVENGNGGFLRYEFSCGDGTVWDPQISACNHAWAVENCGGSTPVNENNNQPMHNVDATSSQSTSTDGETITKSTTEYSIPSSSTELTITSDNQCTTNGFLGDKYDCRKFYRCVDDGKGRFMRYEFSCGEGTVWDSKIQACNHAWAVDSCGNNTSSVATDNSTTLHPITVKDDDGNNYYTQNSQEMSSSTESNSWSTVKASTASSNNEQCNNEGFMADTHDCKKFYRCVNDGTDNLIRYEFTCGDGTVWDSEINACNHVNAVKKHCSIASVQTTESSRPNTMSSTLETTNPLTTSKPSYSQVCEQEGFMGDKEDCKKFYRCTDNGQGGFNRYEFSCGEGTVWDQKILACNHATSDHQCSSTDTVPHGESNETSVTTTTTTSPNIPENTQKTETPVSKDECVSEGFHANSNDCKKFFRCVDDGKGGFLKYDFTCGDGTVWVQNIQACDHENDNSHCNINVITTSAPSYITQEQPITTSSSVLSSSTTNSYTSTVADEYTQSSQKPASSSENICQSEGFYPNSKDCTKFYQCVNNDRNGYNKYEFSCSEGTAWDINTQSCNHISEVKSCQGSNHVESETKPTMQDESVSESSSTTEAGSKDSSTTGASTSDTCEESGYYGNSKDCKKFYRCVDNGKGGFTKYDYTCGDGTIWDQDITACNHPQDVTKPSCKKDESTTTTMTTTTTTTKTEPSETTTKSSSTSSAAQSTTEPNQNSQGSSTKNPNNNNYTCTEAGFYPDPYDCKKFYRCVDWGGDGRSFSIFHFDCAEGTIWDPELQTCNYEDSVYPPRDCSGTQSQNENGTETSEGTTTKQEETSESSTSEGSTTTTTQKSTTDQTSTQQSSTAEQTTSTQKSTTEQSTTEQSTTQQSTTEQSTTPQSTTEQSTTQQSTTEKSTTQQSTTEQSTTAAEQSTSTTTEQSTTTTTTEQTTTSTEESSTTTTQSTISESTTSAAEQTTKAEQTTTQESNTEESSENPSSTTESSTTQESTDGSSTTESGQDTTTEKESSEKECPETDDDQYLYVCPTGFRRHPKYCNLFYQCTEDDDSHDVKLAVFTCPNNTIYDENKIQCVEEEKAEKKCDGQIAQKRRVKRLDSNYKEPILVNRQTYSCPTVGHFPFERNEECSPVLLKCEATKTGKLRGLVYQCPEGFVYWSISRRCEPINVTGCKPSLSDWTGRYEIPTERKNVARKK